MAVVSADPTMMTPNSRRFYESSSFAHAASLSRFVRNRLHLLDVTSRLNCRPTRLPGNYRQPGDYRHRHTDIVILLGP